MNSGKADRLTDLQLLALAIGISFLLAYVITTDQVILAVGIFLTLGGVLVFRWNRGVLVGILVLLILNGVPFANTRPSAVEGTNALDDIAFLVLVAVLAMLAIGRSRSVKHEQILRFALLWAFTFFVWWGLKMVISVVNGGIPMFAAVTYGRDFLYFIIFLPLILAGLRRPQHLMGFTLTLAMGASLYSVGQVVSVATKHYPAWLIHIGKTSDFQGVVRIYAPMNDLLIAAFPLAVAAALLGPRRWRRYAIIVAGLTGVANALSFTRAVYVSEVAGLIVISCLWVLGAGKGARTVRRAGALAGLLTAMVVLALAGGSAARQSNSTSPVQAVLARAELGFTDVQDQSGNVGYRVTHVERELQILGPHWLAGLGFLNPKYHYFYGLRNGSIRDSDLGSLNVIMTMGIIGLVLAYLPLVGGLVFLLKRRKGWLGYGVAMYLSAALVGSITLATVSSVSGLLVMGSALAIALNSEATSSSRHT